MTFRPLRNRDFEEEPNWIRVVYNGTMGVTKDGKPNYDEGRYGCGRWFIDTPRHRERLERWAQSAMGQHSGIIYVEVQKII